MIRVFLDANVYFAGCVSPSGASAIILELARRKRFQLVTSRLVLREAERNLRSKASRKTLQAFHRFLQATDVVVAPSPEEKIVAQYETVIHPKDIPVLVAALKAEVDYLVTLDRRHFLTKPVLALARRAKILTPGDFLKSFVRHTKEAI